MITRSTILYLDDDKDWHDRVTRALANEFDVVAVTTVDEFLQRIVASDQAFGLFLVDLVVEGARRSDASERLLRLLKQEHPDIPRLALTSGEADDGTDKRVAELGCPIVFKGKDLRRRLLRACRRALDPNATAEELEGDRIDEQESKRKELRGDVAFKEEWMRVCNGVVDENVRFDEFRIDVLRFIMRHFAGIRAAALFTIDSSDAARAVRTSFAGDTSSSVSVECVPRKELGDKGEIKSALTECSAGVSVDDTRGAAASWRQNFGGATLADFGSKDIIFVPLCEAPRSGDKPIVAASARTFGAVILYPDARDSIDDTDLERLNGLFLSTFLSSARDMPFRLYEDRSRFRNFAVPLVRVVRRSFLVAAAVVPLLFFGFLGYAVYEHTDPAVELLKGIAIAVIFFTFLLFSLGLIALYDPAVTRVLPSWMVRFARPPEIERLVLTSAVSLTALLIVGMLAARLESYSDVSKAATVLGESARIIATDHRDRTGDARTALKDAQAQLGGAMSQLRLSVAPRSPGDGAATASAPSLDRLREDPAIPVPRTGASIDKHPPSSANSAQASAAISSIVVSVAKLAQASSLLPHSDTVAAREVEKLHSARKELRDEMAKVTEASSIGVLWTCLGGVALIAGIGVFQRFAASTEAQHD